MNRLILLILSAACVATASARVRIGENLLFNGLFDGDQVEFPNGWVAHPSALPPPEWKQSGGPGGIPSVTLAICTDPKADSRVKQDRALQQDGLKLSAKGRFRVSAKLRTTGFSQPNPGKDLFVLGVTDDRWEKIHGFSAPIPGIEGKWTDVSTEFDGFPSKTGSYSFYAYFQHFTGTIEIADVRLEAVDEDAAAGTMPGFAAQLGTIPRIIPWTPLLGEIPETTREAAFRFFGQLPEGTSAADYDLTLTVAETGRLVAKPLAVGDLIRLRVPDGRDEGVLDLKVAPRAGGDALVARSFRYRIAKVPSAANLRKHVRLNTVVTEVLRETARKGVVHPFGTKRRGWVFVSVGSAPEAKVSAKLDGREVIFADMSRHETVREIPSGDHTLEVFGAADGDTVVVRRIPDIFNYCSAPAVVKESGPYDWPFQERYVLPGVTTIDGGDVPPEARPGLRRRGYLWIDNMHSLDLKDDDDLYARLERRPSLGGDVYGGVSLDEQHWYNFEHNSRLMKSLRRYDLEKRPDKAFYTWIIDKPLRLESDTDVMSACANMSFGRGKLITENYCRTKATEADADNYLVQYVKGTVVRYREMYPEIVGSLGVVLGNFNQMPVFSCVHHPEVDYRQFLDKQFNLVANDPAFEGLGLVGLWGSYYADRALHTWCFKLTRHYFIEGRTDMLSDACGLSYAPGHVLNGDFRETLAPWTAEGDVATDAVENLGYLTEARWGGNNGLGDTFARFTRGNRPNALRQTLKGLVPGRRYCLQFITFDVDALRAGAVKVARFGLDAVFGGGTAVDAARSWVHVDSRTKGRISATGRTTPNLHHIVFTAPASEVELTITDAAAKPGETLGLNAVSVQRDLDD